MGMTDFGNLRKVFGKDETSAIEYKELLKEVALMTLSRATNADTNIHPVEVETVQHILKRMTDEDFSAPDIRLAAKSELFEKAPLGKYISRASRKLEAADRMSIAEALAEVIRSDVRISSFETEFFDMVANALRLSPSQLVGLSS